MIKIRSILLTFFIAFLVLGVSSCGGDSSDDNNNAITDNTVRYTLDIATCCELGAMRVGFDRSDFGDYFIVLIENSWEVSADDMLEQEIGNYLVNYSLNTLFIDSIADFTDWLHENVSNIEVVVNGDDVSIDIIVINP